MGNGGAIVLAILAQIVSWILFGILLNIAFGLGYFFGIGRCNSERHIGYVIFPIASIVYDRMKSPY